MIAAVLVSLALRRPRLGNVPRRERQHQLQPLPRAAEDSSRPTCSTSTPTGRGLLQVTNFGLDTFSAFSDHSPDGRTLAFQRFNFEGEDSAPAQVWLTDADGTNARQLTNFRTIGAFDPAFSPDGRMLAIDSFLAGDPASSSSPRSRSAAAARRRRRSPTA